MSPRLPDFVQHGPIGVLPPGHWTCSLAELKTVFAGRSASRMRQAVFEDFLEFVNLQKKVNGSFVTTKRNPGDVDFVALIDRGVVGASPSARMVEMLNPGGTWKRRDHPDLGRRLLVDAFAAVAPEQSHGVAWDEYAAELKTWDARFRNDKTSVGPQKGYVEVTA